MIEGEKCPKCGQNQMPKWGRSETARVCQNPKCAHVEEREVKPKDAPSHA